MPSMRALKKGSAGAELVEAPQPRLCAADDVLIKVHTAALCRTDLYAADGLIPTPPGIVLGHEFSGEIAACGSGASELKSGMRVAVFPIVPSPAGPQFLGVDRDGAFAEYICVPAGVVHPIADRTTYAQAAYAEPVAASLGILSTSIRTAQKGLICGTNRIAELTAAILAANGFADITLASAEQLERGELKKAH